MAVNATGLTTHFKVVCRYGVKNKLLGVKAQINGIISNKKIHIDIKTKLKHIYIYINYR